MSSVETLKNNSVYRLSDLIHRKGIRWEQDRATILEDAQYCNTVLYDYLTKMRFEDDWQVFEAVVVEHSKKYTTPAESDLVVHLRLGDIMEDSDEFRNRSYEKYQRVYGEFDLKIPKNVTRVAIVTALHFGANELNNRYFFTDTAQARSLEILALFRSKLVARGVQVDIQSSSNVDEDFCFLASSKLFVKSYSAMSDLVEKCLCSDAKVWYPPMNDSRKFVPQFKRGFFSTLFNLSG